MDKLACKRLINIPLVSSRTFSGFRSLHNNASKWECFWQLVDGLPVHDVLIVAIVDAREDLLHQYCSILLAKFAALQNFIEELTSFADSTEFG